MTDFDPHFSDLTTTDAGNERPESASSNPRSGSTGRRKSRKATNPPSGSPLLEAIRLWRDKDNRQWTDPEVEEFPEPFFYNLHQEEWQMKALFWEKFSQYLLTKDQEMRILDVGSGCGWMAHAIAELGVGQVVGLELDPLQTDQAKRLFSHPKLRFTSGDFFRQPLPAESFDLVVLCDVMTWMPDVSETVNAAKYYLNPGGELHIMATPFWKNDRARRQEYHRLQEYFEDKRLAQILDFYHLHLREDLEPYHLQYLYQPQWWKRMFAPQPSFAPWVKLKF